MNKNDYIIRLERKNEHREIESLVRESFWNVYRPGCLEHYVLHCLRNDKDFVPEDFWVEEPQNTGGNAGVDSPLGDLEEPLTPAGNEP